jgi:hypothetical protein
MIRYTENTCVCSLHYYRFNDITRYTKVYFWMSAGFYLFIYFFGIDNFKCSSEIFYFTLHFTCLRFMERRYSHLRISVFTLMMCWPLAFDRIWKR